MEDDTLTKLIADDEDYIDDEAASLTPLTPADKGGSPPWSTRKKRYLKYTLCGGIFSIVVILFFTVFIRMIIQGMVDDCTADVLDAILLYPSNMTFSTETTFKMGTELSLPASLQFQELTINWSHEGGGDLIKVQKSNSIKVTKSARTMRTTATVLDVTALSNMMSYALTNGSYTWKITGSVTVTTLITATVNVDKMIDMRGYSSFAYPPVVQNFSVTDGTATVLSAAANCSLTTDSNTAFIFGQKVFFNAIYNGYSVGSGWIPNAEFFTGTFDFVANIGCSYKNNNERKALMDLMSNYIAGRDSAVTLNRFYLESPINWLAAPLYDISLATTIPGVKSVVVQRFDLYISRPNPLRIDFTLDGFNPVDVQMNIVKIFGKVYYQNTLVGLVDDVNISVVIPPKSVVTSQMLYASIIPDQVSLVAQLAREGFGYLDVHSVLTCFLGKFEVNITYTQYNVSSYVHEGTVN